MTREKLAWLVLLAGLGAVPSCGLDDVRDLPIYDVELSAVPDGAHEGRFQEDGFTYVVRTTVQGGRITDVAIVENRDSKYAKMAEAVLPRVLARQTPNVDAVTGATKSSKVLLKAVENSLTVR